MSDEDAPPFSQEELIKKFVAHWDATGVSPVCELCGHEGWEVIGADAADHLQIQFRGRGVPVFVLAYGINCAKCGNIRLFGKGTVDKQLLKTPPTRVEKVR